MHREKSTQFIIEDQSRICNTYIERFSNEEAVFSINSEVVFPSKKRGRGV